MTNLNDDLDNLFGGSGEKRPDPVLPTGYADPVERITKLYSEGCRKCRGSGQWRPGYPCFACKGQGRLTFRTSPEQRSASRAKAAVKRADRAIEKAQELEAWKAEHAAEVAWLQATAARQQRATNPWRFPADLLEKLHQYGSLTEGQLAAVRKFMLRDEQRKAEREASKAAAPTVDVSKIEAAFDRVRGEAAEAGEGVKWLKLFLGTFKFLDAPASNGYAAAILVREGEAKLGRIQDGKFHRNRFACDDAKEQEIVQVLANPSAAARAYGLRTGTCSCCGRELTNAESRRLGIGPVCAEKWGL